ncbi:MAG TPA: ABC transporter ATP-binding protein [Nitrososphaeraceae archaeon]|nr:ABC transporter ATP-binding protein [Nitrososphaeraceae archaeon]
MNYKFSKGKVTLIAGPSGAGKSTLINILSGISPPTEGTILLMGQNLKSDFKKIKPHISCVWNEPSLFTNMSIINNLRFFSSLRGFTLIEINTKINDILNDFEISHDKNKFISNLSLGSKRKVDLCRALINNFEILLLDEPSVYLDNKAKKTLVKILSQYKEAGKSIIIVSHHASLYSNLIDNIIIMKNGQIINNQSIENLINDTKEFRNAFILKTSNRLLTNELLQTLHDIEKTYVSQKAVHVYLKENGDITSIIKLLANKGLKINKIISKEPNLDKLIGEIINAH